MPEIPPIISVDDHVIEPPGVWQDRLPSKYLDVGPRIVRAGVAPVRFEGGQEVYDQDDDGAPCDWWHYEDKRRPITRQYASVGVPPEQVDAYGITFEDMRPGCFVPEERLKDMDANGVEASLCFPNVLPRFCGQTFLEMKDKELGLLCVEAYNDWIVDEWSGGSGGRLIPVCLVPLWNAELAAAEVYRNAARGVHAVSFSELPTLLKLPSLHDASQYWEPFLRACAETRTTVCMHVGSSSSVPTTSPDAPYAVGAMLISTNVMSSFSDWLFSGCLERHPDLRIAYSEGNIGWIPYMLEKADRIWEDQRWLYDRKQVPRPPSEYYFAQVFGCYLSDSFGLGSLDAIGIDNVTFETDYPHTDGTWPNSIAVAERELGGLSQDEIQKIVRTNAIRMLSLDLDA